jgi:hypothetical protein
MGAFEGCLMQKLSMLRMVNDKLGALTSITERLDMLDEKFRE